MSYLLLLMPFLVRCRRFLLFPKGNMQNKDISVYLDCPDAPTERVGWTRYAEFRLGAVNQKYLERSRFQGEYCGPCFVVTNFFVTIFLLSLQFCGGLGLSPLLGYRNTH